jgi:hypothetical protein
MPESQKFGTNYKSATVKMIDGSTFYGKVNIRNYNRLSDFVKGIDERFIIMVSEPDPDEKVFFLKVEHIVWVETKN